MQRKARLNVCFICLACAVDRAGVTPLQSGTRFTRGRVEGSRDKRQDWVKKTGKGRCRRKRGVKAGETTDKCSKPCLSLHDFFFPLSPAHILFLQLRRFTSVSLPPICTFPAHASLSSLTFYQPLSSLYVVMPNTHTRARARCLFFPRSTIFTRVSLTVLSDHVCS